MNLSHNCLTCGDTQSVLLAPRHAGPCPDCCRDLPPGTAIESQAKGHQATGTEEAGRASQGATHVNESTVGLTNPTGCPPLSHDEVDEATFWATVGWGA